MNDPSLVCLAGLMILAFLGSAAWMMIGARRAEWQEWERRQQ